MNKKRRLALLKHRLKRKKLEAKRKAEGAPVGRKRVPER
jgi:hypothetical protein